MNLREIAMLKKFVKDRGMDEMFISLYTKYKLKSNPISIEQYLIEADPSNVFMSAFYWLTNSRFGYDYWQDLQRKWDRYRKDEERIKEFPMKDIRDFKGNGKYLRNNWDNPAFWHIQGRLDTAERYGVKLSDEELQTIANEYERQGYNTETKKHDGSGKDMRLANNELFEREKKENDPLAEFEIIDLDPKSHNARRLQDDEISFNTRNKHGRITFNQKLSNEIKARGNYAYATMGKNKQGDVMLMLNDANGIPIQPTNKTRVNANVTIGSNTLCEKLSVLLNISKDYTVLKVKEIAKTDDYVAYLVSK